MGTSPDHVSENRSTYDRIAPLYLSQQLGHQASGDDLFGRLEQRWAACLPPAARVADLGCGPALDAARFAAAGHQVVGVDFSSGMLASAAPRLQGRLVQADLRAIPFRRAALDGLWCVAALLHVPEEGTERVLGELRAALRAGGALALVTALGTGHRSEPVPYAPGEVRWFVYRSRERLEGQLASAGFCLTFAGEVAGNRSWLTALARAA